MNKIKKFLIFILPIVFLTTFTINVNAIVYGRITNQGAVTRTGPGTNYPTSTYLKYNDIVPIYNTFGIRSLSGCPTGWYRTNINGSAAYICVGDVSTSTKVINTKSEVNMRYGPGTNYGHVTKLNPNVTLTLVNTTNYKGSGCSAGWYRLNQNWSTARYVCSTYTKDYNAYPNAIITNTKGTIVRNSASTSGKTLVTLKYGQALTLVNASTVKGSGCSAGWYKVWYNNTIGYVCSSETVRSNDINLVSDTGGVNVRTAPNTSSSIITYFDYLDEAVLTSTSKYSGSGCSAGWYRIHINGKTGYVCSSYVSNNTLITKLNANTIIRKSASSTSNSVITLKKGQYVILYNAGRNMGTGCKNGWYKMVINNTTSYVCSDHTELSNPPDKNGNVNIPKESPAADQAQNNNTSANTNSNTSSNTNTSTSSTSTGPKKTTAHNTKYGKYYTTNTWSYRLREDYGYVRSGANTGSSIQNVVYLGTEFEVLGSSGATSGCSAGWYKVKYYGNTIGYVCKSLVEKYTDVTKNDSSYCNTLKNAGFPSSYCPFLSYLHAKHPKWVFKAENTKMNFIDAINGEHSRNYTQISTNARSYLESTTIRESGGWRTASDAYVAYMIDPRNYLNEQNIFAFEYLGYDSAFHTSSVIRAMVKGTYLDNDTYAGYFIDAAKSYKVSPVHLAARVKQEGGSNANYDSVSGKANGSCSLTTYVCSTYTKMTSSTTGRITETVNLRNGAGTGNTRLTEGLANETFTLVDTKKYSGSGCSAGWYKIKLTRSFKNIYNYYNIGAYGSNPVNRGLQTAAGCVDVNPGTPWNSRPKAIKYGAAFIADGYITSGQYTMFYQKFNVGPNTPYGKCTHQYMTNILAPASESLSTYDSYSSQKILDNGYVFKIPVYNNMPSDFTQHPPV